jgi:hypothetical protein
MPQDPRSDPSELRTNLVSTRSRRIRAAPRVESRQSAATSSYSGARNDDDYDNDDHD